MGVWGGEGGQGWAGFRNVGGKGWLRPVLVGGRDPWVPPVSVSLIEELGGKVSHLRQGQGRGRIWVLGEEVLRAWTPGRQCYFCCKGTTLPSEHHSQLLDPPSPAPPRPAPPCPGLPRGPIIYHAGPGAWIPRHPPLAPGERPGGQADGWLGLSCRRPGKGEMPSLYPSPFMSLSLPPPCRCVH